MIKFNTLKLHFHSRTSHTSLPKQIKYSKQFLFVSDINATSMRNASCTLANIRLAYDKS
jgi:hypothetical protein